MSILKRARSRLPQEYLAGGGIVQYRQTGGGITSPAHGRYSVTQQQTPTGSNYGQVQYQHRPWDIGNFATTLPGLSSSINTPIVDMPTDEMPVDDVVTTTTDDSSGGGGPTVIPESSIPPVPVGPTTIPEHIPTPPGHVPPEHERPSEEDLDEWYGDTDRPDWAQPTSDLIPGHPDFDWGGPGGTSYGDDYGAVISAYYDLLEAGDPNLPGGTTPGLTQDQGHAVVEGSFNNYGDNVLNNDNYTNAEKAALNPAFNVDQAITNAQETKTITDHTTGQTYDVNAGSLTSEDFSSLGGDNYGAAVDDYGYIDATQPVGSTSGGSNAHGQSWLDDQHSLAADSLLSAGIGNIGGGYNQSGDNAGLPLDYLVVGSSDGGSEVWGPNGEVFDSIEEAQVAAGVKEPVTAPPTQEQAEAHATSVAQSGGAQHQVVQAGVAAGLTPQQAAIIYEQNKKETGAERREQAEINRRAAEAKAAAEQAKADEQAHLATLSAADQADFKATKAIESGDKGDLKTTIYDLAASGDLTYSGSLRKKSTAELIAILEGATNKNQGGILMKPTPMKYKGIFRRNS